MDFRSPYEAKWTWPAYTSPKTLESMADRCFLFWKHKSPGLFGDVLANIPSLAIYLFHTPTRVEQVRCTAQTRVLWSTEVCFVCSPSLCMPSSHADSESLVISGKAKGCLWHKHWSTPPPPSLCLFKFHCSFYSHFSACLGCCEQVFSLYLVTIQAINSLTCCGSVFDTQVIYIFFHSIALLLALFLWKMRAMEN